MKIAFVIGGADCVWRDRLGALEVAGQPDMVVAVNNIGIALERVDHWISLHPQKLDRWQKEREARGLPAAGKFWSHKQVVPGPTVSMVDWIYGTSALGGVQAALFSGAERVICCGVPLSAEYGYFDGVPEGKGHSVRAHLADYRKCWREHERDLKPRVRSMSGWTAELLGVPDEAWLREEARA